MINSNTVNFTKHYQRQNIFILNDENKNLLVYSYQQKSKTVVYGFRVINIFNGKKHQKMFGKLVKRYTIDRVCQNVIQSVIYCQSKFF